MSIGVLLYIIIYFRATKLPGHGHESTHCYVTSDWLWRLLCQQFTLIYISKEILRIIVSILLTLINTHRYQLVLHYKSYRVNFTWFFKILKAHVEWYNGFETAVSRFFSSRFHLHFWWHVSSFSFFIWAEYRCQTVDKNTDFFFFTFFLLSTWNGSKCLYVTVLVLPFFCFFCFLKILWQMQSFLY